MPYAYRYGSASAVTGAGGDATVRLVTSLEGTSQDIFFDGLIRQPALVGQMLSVLAGVTRRRFDHPRRPILLDPVVTAGGGCLRFEGFSSCGGAYARVDLDPESVDADVWGKGTTNVDFGDTMHAALRRLPANRATRLRVGGAEVSLRSGSQTIIERKVKLPVRWIRGFGEVQAYQARMIEHFQVDRGQAQLAWRGLPPGSATRNPTYLTKTAGGFRFTSRGRPEDVRFHGTDRLRVLQPLMPHVNQLTIWFDEPSGVSGWELDAGVGRFYLVLSPQTHRGFSGEGQLLTGLTAGGLPPALPMVTDALRWQSSIDVTALVRSAKDHAQRCGESDIQAALAVLSVRGLVGFDLRRGAYFHRVLPFKFDHVEDNQPRLLAARRLAKSGGVTLLTDNPAERRFAVLGTDVVHTVRLTPRADRCTCLWFTRHQGQRGPCKHILAARIITEESETS